jgi:hypothetical protein
LNWLYNHAAIGACGAEFHMAAAKKGTDGHANPCLSIHATAPGRSEGLCLSRRAG